MLFRSRGLIDVPKLVPVLEKLGQGHAGYGVRDEHYDTVGAAFLWTLEQGLGAAFTPAVKAAWVEVYGVVATTMKRAAAAAPQQPSTNRSSQTRTGGLMSIFGFHDACQAEQQKLQQEIERLRSELDVARAQAAEATRQARSRSTPTGRFRRLAAACP